jgi:hypothetical protein
MWQRASLCHPLTVEDQIARKLGIGALGETRVPDGQRIYWSGVDRDVVRRDQSGRSRQRQITVRAAERPKEVNRQRHNTPQTFAARSA